MKKLATLLLLSLLAAPAQAEGWKGACDPIEIWSRYVLPIGIRLSDEPVVQGSCNLSNGSTTVGVFLSQSLSSPGLDSGRGTYGNEMDYFIAWSGKLSDTMTIDAGLQYLDFVRLFRAPSGDAFNAYGKLSYKGSALWEPYIRLDTFTGLGSERIPSGWYVQLGAKSAFSGVSLDASVLRNDGVNDIQVNLIRIEIAGVNHCLKGSGFSACPIARVTAPISGPQKSEFTVGLRIGF